MQKLYLAGLLLCLSVVGQEQNKPLITSIKTLPSDPIPQGPWSCKDGSAGYLEEKGGRIDLTDMEIGDTIGSYLRSGYTVTIYPKTAHGIFVDLDCNSNSHP